MAGDISFELIPDNQRETARLALAAAFGREQVGGLRPVSGGASGALTYAVDVSGRSYLLRIETRRSSPLRNPHQYLCMESAAAAGIAPPVRYVDDAIGVAIMDLLPQRPLQEYPGGPTELARDLGSLVARLQTVPTFPQLTDYQTLLDRLLGFLRRSPAFAAGLFEPHREGFERIRAAYPWNGSTLVSSHNDPNPRNIIFDGARLWLVDWETAYRNDPLTDVAILVENFAPTPELEALLLRAWHGDVPSRAIRARLTLMRLLTRLYYGGIMLSISASRDPQVVPDADLAALSPAEFQTAVAEGRVKPGVEALYPLGKMHLAGFLSGLAAPDFEEALIAARAE